MKVVYPPRRPAQRFSPHGSFTGRQESQALLPLIHQRIRHGVRSPGGLVPAVAALVLSWAALPAWGQSWGNSARLYDLDEQSGGGAIKEPKVCRAVSGGFHFAYRVHGGDYGGQHITYRRWNGSLGPKRFVVHGSQYMWGQEIGESLGGHIHVVWENFGPLDIGWSYSTNGGNTFSPYQIISSSSDSGKVPGIAPFGTSGNEMIMAYTHTATHRWYYNRWTGSTWLGQIMVGPCESFYFASGIDRSPADGSVWKSVGYTVNGVTSPAMHRFDGTSWSPGVIVAPTGFFARQSIAVNQSGQVMYLWEFENGMWSRLYTPGVGWGDIQQPGTNHGSVTAIPGTNDFYMVYTDLQRVYGRRWNGFMWLPAELVSVGQPAAYVDNCDVAAGNDGSLAAAWEYWGANAEAWYSIKPAPAPQIDLSTTSISRSVWVGNNLTNDTFYVKNGGTGTINYTITDNVAWLSVNPTTGSSTGEYDPITVIYSVAGLLAGTYSGTITVSAPEAWNNPRTVAVTVTINTVKPDFNGDGDVDLEDFAHLQRCFSGQAVPQSDPACQNARLDNDTDVDGNDLLLFRGCMSGAGILANPTCM